MKVYYDTEFTGLHKDTTLISIGLISDSNKQFYAELTDFDKTQVDEWIQNNVINNLTLEKDINLGRIKVSDNLTLARGNKLVIREALNEWLKQFDTIEWVSDVCHYDFVLLIDLIYGHALRMPSNYCSACHDINQNISEYLKINEIEAFDINREEFAEIKDTAQKHNSLWDAKVIKACYDKINN